MNALNAVVRFSLLLVTLAGTRGVSQQPAPASDSAQQVEAAASESRTVLITGASSGIGRKTTEVLAGKGFFVFAGARKDADLRALDAIDNVQSVRLDVTVQADIDAAVEAVKKSGRGLDALINNAGVLVVAPLIELREADLDFQLDVNLYGPFRLAKAFAPMLIESKGRIVTTGSISGTVTWAMGGPYCISKHSVEAFTDVLAAELEPFDVAVSVVDPGNYRSRIMTNMKDRLEKGGYTTAGSRYQNRLDRMLESPADREQYKEPDEVAQAFLRALTDERPQRRYMVVPNAREARVTLEAAMRRVVQLNQGHEHSVDRDALIRMLDAALEQAK